MNRDEADDPERRDGEIDALFREATATCDAASLRERFEAQGRMVVLDDFVPKPIVEALVSRLPALADAVHRNYVPGQKKGGSVSRHTLDRREPDYGALYRAPALRGLLETITGDTLLDCRADDPHTYALYHYSESGDHIGWHYDTSFYRGRRYTVLIGLQENDSCRLECELHRDDPTRESESVSIAIRPGTLVLFDGDRLWHRVTPMAEGDRDRVVLTLEYVTDASMSRWRHLISSVKDAAAYFGWREVFLGPREDRRTP